jgi:hypothetical protein
MTAKGPQQKTFQEKFQKTPAQNAKTIAHFYKKKHLTPNKKARDATGYSSNFINLSAVCVQIFPRTLSAATRTIGSNRRQKDPAMIELNAHPRARSAEDVMF